MNCNSCKDELLDLATGVSASGEVEQHLQECAACREQLAGLRATMSAMDDWVAPEPSPYFDTRLQARLREEKEREPHGVFAWFRRPALAGAGIAALVIGASVTMFQGRNTGMPNSKQDVTVSAARGTAVGDLQYLDKHADLLSDFDLLDDMDNDSRTFRQ